MFYGFISFIQEDMLEATHEILNRPKSDYKINSFAMGSTLSCFTSLSATHYHKISSDLAITVETKTPTGIYYE